jgi:hypothetical protein
LPQRGGLAPPHFSEIKIQDAETRAFMECDIFTPGRPEWRVSAREGGEQCPNSELEFLRPDHVPWPPVAGSPTAGAAGAGVQEKILNRDPESGDVTRLLKLTLQFRYKKRQELA